MAQTNAPVGVFNRHSRWLPKLASAGLMTSALTLSLVFCGLAVRNLLVATETTADAEPPTPQLIRLVKTIPAVTAGDTAVEELALTNPTRRAVTVQGVRSSCGCSTSELVKQPIEPGETVTLKVSMRTAGRMGPYRLVSMVDVVDGPSWECVLEVTVKPVEKQPDTDGQ